MAVAHILLVDDDESFRPALQATLEKLGFRVTASPNGADAKALLRAGSFDLVISDIRMPEVDGIALTRFVKARPKKLPVILITGFSDILETRTAYDLGADAFLAKPVDREELSTAIQRCLGRAAGTSVVVDEADSFCRLSIDDFTSGAQIQFNIFVQLAETKFIKIAHQGEDLSVARINAFKKKGLRFLFLRTADFCSYVNFNVVLSGAVKDSRRVSPEKKLNLLKHTGQIIQEQINHLGIDIEVYEGAASFVQTTVQILSDDPDVFALLEILNGHGDHAYAHGVGTSLYGVLMAQKLSWKMPTNRFKVAMGGLLHDVGERALPIELLSKSRVTWTDTDLSLFESHPERGTAQLEQIPVIPVDVLQIVKQHHEYCNGTGFPGRLRRNRIHPMARVISIASEFCSHVVITEKGPGVAPQEALGRMKTVWADRFDPEFFGALCDMFQAKGSEARVSER